MNASRLVMFTVILLTGLLPSAAMALDEPHTHCGFSATPPLKTHAWNLMKVTGVGCASDGCW